MGGNALFLLPQNLTEKNYVFAYFYVESGPKVEQLGLEE